MEYIDFNLNEDIKRNRAKRNKLINSNNDKIAKIKQEILYEQTKNGESTKNQELLHDNMPDINTFKNKLIDYIKNNYTNFLKILKGEDISNNNDNINSIDKEKLKALDTILAKVDIINKSLKDINDDDLKSSWSNLYDSIKNSISERDKSEDKELFTKLSIVDDTVEGDVIKDNKESISEILKDYTTENSSLFSDCKKIESIIDLVEQTNG